MLVAIRARQPQQPSASFLSDQWFQEIGTAHSGYPVSKLKTDNTDDVVRAYGQRQSHTRIQARSEILSKDITLDYVALIGINRGLPRAPAAEDITRLPNRARLIIDLTLIGDFDTQEPPISSSPYTLTNLTGAYTILNQVLNPPEETVVGYTPSSLTVTNPAVNTQVIAAFTNYSSSRPLAISPDPINHPLQRFLVHIKNSNGDLNTLPNVAVILRQGTSDIRTLSYDQVETTDEGFIFTYFWDAGELPSPTGVVLIKIVGTSNGSVVPVPISILWRAEVTGLVYESVPLTYDGSGNPIFWQDNPDADIVNERMLVWRPNITIPAGSQYRVLIELSDFSATSPVVVLDHLGGFTGAFSYTPLGSAFVAGRFIAGEAINVPLHEIGGASLRKSGNNQGGLITSYGGHLRANRTDLTRWEGELSAIPQSQTRIFGELDDLFRDLGFILPTLFLIDNADVKATLWAVLTAWETGDLGAMTGEDYPGAGTTTEQRYDLKIGIIEAGAHSTKIDG